MFMPLGASVLSLKISLLSSLCLDAVPPFTCLTTVTFMSHVLDVAVLVGQIKVLGHGKTSSMIAGITIVSLHRPKEGGAVVVWDHIPALTYTTFLLPADHEIAHQWSGNPLCWDPIYQHQRKPQRLLVKLLTNILNTKRKEKFNQFIIPYKSHITR